MQPGIEANIISEILNQKFELYMELESKNKNSTQLHFNNDSHPDDQPPTTTESFQGQEALINQDLHSPIAAANPYTTITAMSGNFDEVPLPAKANLTFEEMLEASLKDSQPEGLDHPAKGEFASKPPKPKVANSKFTRMAPQKSKPPVLMDEETSSNVLASSEQIVPENEISPEGKKMKNASLVYSQNLPAEDNQAIAMSIEDEKPIKVSIRKDDRDKAKEFGRHTEDYGDTEQTFEKHSLQNLDQNQFFQAGSDKEFDEVPVGKTGFFIPEFAEGSENLNEEGSQLQQDSGPLENRVKSKVWKVRQSAFEELVQKFQTVDSEDMIFNEYSNDLPKFINDANPGAQEKAIEALRVYVERRNGSGIEAKNVVKTLVDKALAPGKPNIKKITLETLCIMFEKMNKQEILDGLVDSINNKNQKVSCAGVQGVVELLTNYGPKKLDFLKPFYSSIEKLAGSTVSSLRTEAMNFYKEAYRFMGEALKPFITKLKKQQIDELEKYFSECPKELARPLKGDQMVAKTTASNGAASGAQADDGVQDLGDDDDGGAIDAYEIAEPVDLFKRFNETWSEKVLAKEKWIEKKTMLEELLKEAVNTPRIAPTPFPHITNMLKKLLNDSNQNVMITAVKIYGALAKGLRKNFVNACKNNMLGILGKLKDKRTQVLDETGKTLENFLYCINLEDVLDDIKEVLADKAPGVKLQVLKWMEKAFEKNSKNTDKVTVTLKAVIPIIKKLLEDGAVEVREASIQTLAKLKSFLPDSAIGNNYNDINPSKLAKINDLAASMVAGNAPESASKLSSLGGGSLTNNRKNKPNLTLNDSIEEEKSTQAKRPGTRGGDSKLDNKPHTSRSNAAGAKQMQQSGLKKVGSMKALGTAQGASAIREEQDITSTLSAEEAEAKMMDLNLPESVLKGLESAAWKEKQQALIDFSMFCRDNASVVSPYIEYAFKFLKTKLKDWKESNLNVIKETLLTVSAIASCPEITLTKRSFNIILPLVANNLHDVKYNEACCTIVNSYVQAITPKTVILALINSFQESKDNKVSKTNPKALAELCALFTKLLDVLTLSFFPLKETIDFNKTVLANQNIAARNAAINLFKAIYQQLGSPLTEFLNDVNPQTLKTLQAEFEKIVPNKQTECKIQFRGEAQSEIKEQGGSNQNPLDSLPRADISRDAEKILKKLNDGDWKVRKEGLDALEGVISANNNRILPNGLQELTTTLKNRLSDNNKGFLKSCLHFVGKFASALGPNVRVYAKTLIVELVKNLSDKTPALRTETLAALDKFAAEVGGEIVINYAFPSLNQENPELRLALIQWILKNEEGLYKADLKPTVTIMLAVLQDKTKDVRNNGEKLLEKCIGVLGPQPYLAAIKDLKPAIQKALTPIVQKYSGSTMISEPDVDSDGNNSFEQKIQPRGLKKTPSEATLKTIKQTQRPGTAAGPSAQDVNHSHTLVKKVARNASPKKSVTPNASISNIQLNTSTISNPGLNSSRSTSTTLINMLGQKGRRQEEEKKARWNTEELKDDLVERLKENLKKNVAVELYQKMFSFDVRKQAEAVQSLRKALVEQFQGTVDILDLVIRWLFFRLWDNSNTQLTKEALDYVFNMVLSLEAAKYSLEDFELSVLVPFLLQKLVTGHQNFKITLYKIFQKLGEVSQIQKVSALLVQSIIGKNNKVRNEALDVLLVLVKEYRDDTMNQKEIKTLGKLLGHTDATIRNLSFNVLAELGLYMKDDLLRILRGEAPSKALETLQQRIRGLEGMSKTEKRNYSDDYSVNMYEEGAFGGIKASHIVSNSFILDKDNSYDAEVNEHKDPYHLKYGNTINRDRAEATSTVDSKDHIRDTRDTSLIGTPQNNTKGCHVVGGYFIEEELFDRSLNQLVNGSISNRLDALLVIHDIVTNDTDQTREFIKMKANDLISTLHITLRSVFEKPKNEIPIKFIFYFLNMTHKLCNIRSFLKNVNEDNLRAFSEELLHRLLAEDEEKKAENADEFMVKTLNSTMLRVLEHADPNAMFNVLFDLLIKNRRLYSYAKILGLIVKCILKLAKALPQIAHSIHPDRILLKFHLYIIEFGAKQMDDIGIKTIKTLLGEITKVYQDGIWDAYARGVQIHPKKDECLHKWISTILRHNSAENKDEYLLDMHERNIQERENSNQEREELRPKVHTSQLAQSIKIDASNQGDLEIKQIIMGLKDSEDLSGGVKQLHRALKKYPGLDLSNYLKGSTPAFSDYVIKALERLDSREGLKVAESYSVKAEPKNSSTMYEDRDRVEKIGREAVSPMGAGSNTLTLEDFQSKVNSLKERYGLIVLKKTPEMAETTTKPLQVTNVTDKKLQETFPSSNNTEIASQYTQGLERTDKKEFDTTHDKESTKYRGFEELSRLGALGTNTYASSSLENKTMMGSNLGPTIASDYRTRAGTGVNYTSSAEYGYGVSTVTNNNTTGASLASNMETDNNLTKNTTVNRVETVTNATMENSNNAMNRTGTEAGSEAGGPGRSTENILQKLSEMKLKMTNIMNSSRPS